ncbi:hypothetical protein ACFY71_09685 [Streptomyces cinerochromogenes]|uniref:hypothetical protein n=1 Tax=Streptomyces cinerochromogenes TaxID=66422 RepID=UPI00367CFFF3
MPSTAGPRTPVPNRRGFLTTSLAASAGVLTVPAVAVWLPAADAKAATGPAAFVDDYRTNTLADLTPGTNAVVRVLGGFGGLWRTASAWNTGTPLRPDIQRADLRYCARVTAERTDAEAEEAFVHDRQHQSYALIAGLGPLAGPYRTAAKAVTSITGAPDGTPAATVRDAVPAAAGSALPVLAAPRLSGGVERIVVNSEGLLAVPVYTAEGLSVRLVRR